VLLRGGGFERLQAFDFRNDATPRPGAGMGTLVRQLVRAARSKVASAGAMLLDHEQRRRLNIPVRGLGHADSIACGPDGVSR